MDQRAERMKNLIIRTFFTCLAAEDFSTLTVGKVSSMAQINRSTFYRYFEDKYLLRDHVIDHIVSDFVSNLEVDFLDMDIAKDQSYRKTLENSLEHIRARRQDLEILWNQHTLGRNVFEEMIEAGAGKIEQRILSHPDISDSKKKNADWYARLLLNNLLVSVRWWFANQERIGTAEMAQLIRQHMMTGTIPTLKGTS